MLGASVVGTITMSMWHCGIPLDPWNYETLRNRKEIVGLIEPEDLGPGFAVEHGPWKEFTAFTASASTACWTQRQSPPTHLEGLNHPMIHIPIVITNVWPLTILAHISPIIIHYYHYSLIYHCWHLLTRNLREHERTIQNLSRTIQKLGGFQTRNLRGNMWRLHLQRFSMKSRSQKNGLHWEDFFTPLQYLQTGIVGIVVKRC